MGSQPSAGFYRSVADSWSDSSRYWIQKNKNETAVMSSDRDRTKTVSASVRVWWSHTAYPTVDFSHRVSSARCFCERTVQLMSADEVTINIISDHFVFFHRFEGEKNECLRTHRRGSVRTPKNIQISKTWRTPVCTQLLFINPISTWKRTQVDQPVSRPLTTHIQP